MIVLPRHARRSASIDQVRPSEQVDEAVARGKIDRVCHSASVKRVEGIAVAPMRNGDTWKSAHTPRSAAKPQLPLPRRILHEARPRSLLGMLGRSDIKRQAWPD